MPSKDSDQTGQPSLISLQCPAWRKVESLATHWVHSEDSNQTGRMHRLISLCWVHRSFCWFCHAVAQLYKNTVNKDFKCTDSIHYTFTLTHFHTQQNQDQEQFINLPCLFREMGWPDFCCQFCVYFTTVLCFNCYVCVSVFSYKKSLDQLGPIKRKCVFGSLRPGNI